MNKPFYTYNDSEALAIAVENIPRFKCYACLSIKPLDEFGVLHRFKDFEKQRSYAVCRKCSDRLGALEDSSLGRLTKLFLAERNVLSEIYPPGSTDVRNRGTYTQADIWFETEQGGKDT